MENTRWARSNFRGGRLERIFGDIVPAGGRARRVPFDELFDPFLRANSSMHSGAPNTATESFVFLPMIIASRRDWGEALRVL